MPASKPKLPILNRAHPLARGLVGAWLFYEGSGATTRDLKRGLGNGTINGATWVSSPGGRALRFVTAGSDVTVGVNPPNQSFTFVTRCVSESAAPSSAYLGGVQSGGNNGGRFIRAQSGKFQLELVQGGIRDANGANNIVANRWYSVAGVCDLAAAQTRLYEDGVLVGTGSASGITTFTSITNLKFGERPDQNGNNWTGSIEFFYIYNRALTAGEVRALHVDPYAAFRISITMYASFISASTIGSTARLNWQDNSGNEAGFSVERSPTSATGGFVEIDTVEANTTQYDDEDLSAGTYWYRVRAIGAGGLYSDYSNVAEVTIA